MITFYAIAMSSYCAKTRILLRHKDIPHIEMSPPGGYGSDEYKKIVPSGNLPTLVDGNLVIGDSEAIAEYLEEKFPQPAALPIDLAARAKVRERSRFADTRLDPEVRALYPHVRPSRRDTTKLAEAVQALQVRLNQLGRILDETPDAGNELTLADCGLPISLFWIGALEKPLGFAINWPGSVLAYRRRIGEIPAVKAEFATYVGPAEEWIDLASKDKA